jgi:hypothetical protein
VPKELNALTCTIDSAIIGHQMFFPNSVFALGGVQGGKLYPQSSASTHISFLALYFREYFSISILGVVWHRNRLL